MRRILLVAVSLLFGIVIGSLGAIAWVRLVAHAGIEIHDSFSTVMEAQVVAQAFIAARGRVPANPEELKEFAASSMNNMPLSTDQFTTLRFEQVSHDRVIMIWKLAPPLSAWGTNSLYLTTEALGKGP